MKQTIFITRKLPEEVIQPLREKFTVRMWEEEEIEVPVDVLKKEVQQADALWTTISDQITKEIMTSAPNLKVIANLAVGFNNIDVEAAKELGITVTNTPDVLTETTADLAFALLLASARRITEAERVLRDGKWTSWAPMQLTGMDVFGATLGIIGMGRIGEAAAKRAKGFDMNVLYYNRTRKLEAEEKYGFSYAELDSLLQQSDFVLIFAPLTEETKNMIAKRELGLMKKTAILLNVARGGIVNEQDLYDALKNGDIWGAGLDVFETEPVPLNHPLLTLPNVTVLPHIGSASIQTRLAMMKMNQKAIMDVLEGRVPKNVVI
ncbi:D-glycerate dehydrogenase [Sporosarcina pasteurii]|uniref:Glyoxylate/hydroxypyruvate reductase B n=1 Tax=Sporosarcina pasteurii TaxID=1474 RepID=A0A380BC13_SPOPA|nr:D-glycerate dehydrogenase [Sporosarcina pasteurii]MDS9472395.1 D-glycerate dehydrogenase [Sporosarcina pasteurii]SUI98885.1 Glyoxylate/hydroxypyruvate reductase B [Sporosarcina pasteurii]